MAHPSYTINVCYPIARPAVKLVEPTRSTRILRQGRVKVADVAVFFASMYLYEDRLVLEGWRWNGQYQREIRLSNLTEIRWVNSPGVPGNLILALRSGELLTLGVKGVGMWKYTLDEQCGHGLASMRFEEDEQPWMALAA